MFAIRSKENPLRTVAGKPTAAAIALGLPEG
jgi:hypothetical protein